jgi:hypothetical protein
LIAQISPQAARIIANGQKYIGTALSKSAGKLIERTARVYRQLLETVIKLIMKMNAILKIAIEQELEWLYRVFLNNTR